MVAQLHVELLAGISSNKKNLNEETWAAYLANRLTYERLRLTGKPEASFKPAKRQEAVEYAALPIRQRYVCQCAQKRRGVCAQISCIQAQGVGQASQVAGSGRG